MPAFCRRRPPSVWRAARRLPPLTKVCARAAEQRDRYRTEGYALNRIVVSASRRCSSWSFFCVRFLFVLLVAAVATAVDSHSRVLQKTLVRLAPDDNSFVERAGRESLARTRECDRVDELFMA